MLREIENAKTVRNEDVQVGDYIIANHISATGGADANLLEGLPFEDTVAKVDGIINVKGVVNLVTSGKLLNGITDVAKGDSWTVVRPNKLAHINGEYLVVPLPERTLSTYLGAGWLQRANLSQLKLAFLEYAIEATFGDTRREDRDSKLKYPGIYYQQAVVLNIKLPEEVE